MYNVHLIVEILYLHFFSLHSYHRCTGQLHDVVVTNPTVIKREKYSCNLLLVNKM